MELSVTTALSILGGLGSLIGIYVNLSNKIQRLEVTLDDLKARVSIERQEIRAEFGEIKRELKEISTQLNILIGKDTSGK